MSEMHEDHWQNRVPTPAEVLAWEDDNDEAFHVWEWDERTDDASYSGPVVLRVQNGVVVWDTFWETPELRARYAPYSEWSPFDDPEYAFGGNDRMRPAICYPDQRLQAMPWPEGKK